MKIGGAHRVVLDHLRDETKRLLDFENENWLTKPIGLEAFNNDSLDLGRMSPRQLGDWTNFLGVDPQQMFANGTPYNTMCWLGGKGSGKDYTGAIIACYALQTLLCMRNPQTFLGQSPVAPLDIILVSYSLPQAIQINLEYVKRMIRRWFWLKSRYSIIDGNRYINEKGKPEIIILENMIKTHNNIRITAQHSANEAYEGYNIILFIMSEASAFVTHTKTRNAEKVYSTLKTSASSRFGTKWKGIVMSFPRHDQDEDFTYNLYLDRLKDSTIYGTCGATWDFLPAHLGKYSGKTFDFEGHQVPIEHQSSFDSDPNEAKRKYLCIPDPGGAEAFDDETIALGVNIDQPPLFRSEEYVEGNEVKVRIPLIEQCEHNPVLLKQLFQYD
jgi:hypothetical protein